MRLGEKMASRKFAMAMYILVAATMLMIVPYVLSISILGTNLFLISGSEWVSLMIGVYGLYVGSNVVNKKVVGPGAANMPHDGDMP